MTAQDGSGVSGVLVTATGAGQTAVQFGPVETGADGSFELPVAAGAYDVHFAPAGALNPIVYTNLLVSGDMTLNVVLTQSTAHSLSGTVRDAAGKPVANVNVQLNALDQSGRGGAARTDPEGHYSISVPPLVYGLQIRATDDTWALYSDPRTYDLTAGDISQDFQLPPFVTLTVAVKDAAGHPISAAQASITSGQQPGFTVAPNVAFLAATGASKQTDANGQAQFSLFAGFNLTSGQICATFPDSTQVCNTTAVTTTNGNTSIVLTKNAVPHSLSGTVRDAAGKPVANVNVQLNALDQSGRGGAARTDPEGHYSISVPPLVYGLQIRATDDTWALYSDPRTYDLTAGDISQDFQLPPFVTLTVAVKDAAGHPISAAQASITSGQQPGFTVAPNVAFLAATGASKQTDANGQAQFSLFAGFNLTSGQICATFPDSTQVCNTTAVTTTNGNTSIVLTKNAVPHSLSGTVRDAAGKPVANVNVQLNALDQSGRGGAARTDPEGHYSISVPPLVYGLQIRATDDTWALYSDPRTYDLTAGDISQDFQLPPFVTLTVAVKDAAGHPISAAQASITSGQQPGFTVAPNVAFLAATGASKQTDANGQAQFSLFAGFNLTSGQICATFPDSTQVCNTTAVTTTNGNTSIVFQRLPAVPAVPTGLSAHTPTNAAPTLTWDAVSGAASYLVYRDGAVTGSTTGTTFTDYALTSNGAFSYSVAAVGSNGAASANSAPVIVVYDTVAPLVSGSPDRAANAAGWYRAPVTITWSTADPAPSSGTPTVPAITSATADGANQRVKSASSCDPAGNCATGQYSVSIDATPPTINYRLTPTPNSDGWNNGDVTVTFTCADDLSGIASCTTPVTVSMNGAEQGIVGTAVDNAGNTASVTAVVNLDAAAPTITASVSQSPNSDGWNNGDVTVTFTCADTLSGVATCSPPVILEDDGPNQVVTGTAIDQAGNSATVTVIISIDQTKPMISAARTPANDNGWNSDDVTVNFTCTDDLSGIATCPNPVTITTEGAAQSLAGTATNHAGIQATATVTGINIDKTPPTIAATIQGTKNSAGWYNVAPTIHYICTDGLSGIAICPADATVTADGPNQANTATAVDKAGNTAQATVSGLNVDLTAPVVAIVGAVDGASYPLDMLPTPSCVTTDPTSGLAASASLSISRNSTGAYTASCAGAIDIAGNAAPSKTITYAIAPTSETLTDLTGQYVNATGAPNVNGAIQDLNNKLAQGQICKYIQKVNHYASEPHPILTPEQAADLTYWARLLDPTC